MNLENYKLIMRKQSLVLGSINDLAKKQTIDEESSQIKKIRLIINAFPLEKELGP